MKVFAIPITVPNISIDLIRYNVGASYLSSAIWTICVHNGLSVGRSPVAEKYIVQFRFFFLLIVLYHSVTSMKYALRQSIFIKTLFISHKWYGHCFLDHLLYPLIPYVVQIFIQLQRYNKFTLAFSFLRFVDP